MKFGQGMTLSVLEHQSLDFQRGRAMSVSLLKDSTAQKFEQAFVEIDKDRREDDLRTFHGLFRWLGGPTINVNHPMRPAQAPVPSHMRALRDGFLEANSS